jgi:hypothetical protein
MAHSPLMTVLGHIPYLSLSKNFPVSVSMKLNLILSSVLAGLLLAVTGARAATPVVITHVADAKKTALTLRITEGVRIVLPVPSPAPAGYEWQIISNDARFLRLTSSPKPAGSMAKAVEKTEAAEDKTASFSGDAWATSFVALRPGRSILRLVYIRASDSGEETAVDAREIAVTVVARQ